MTESQHDYHMRRLVQSCDEAIEGGEERWPALYRLARACYEYGSLTQQEKLQALEAEFAKEGIGPAQVLAQLQATTGRAFEKPKKERWWKI